MTRASSKSVPATARTQVGATLLIILAIPRLVRLLYPAIWVEDDFYLEAAWLVSVGMRPYLDFVHPHFPLLEYFSAAYLKVFGASHFSIEILNEAAIYVNSLLTFKLAARATTRRAAISAAILYATSSLVFRYHVYERECFEAPLILLAAIFALDEHPRIGWIALAMLAACLIKLTAFVAVAVVVGFLAIGRRRWREAMAVAVAIGIGIVAATLLCYALYGREFLFQTYLFHFMKGRTDFVSVVAYPLAILDIQLPLFMIGCIALRNQLRGNTSILLILTMIAAEYLFFGILSPTAWAHNYLEGLPFIAIVGGIGVDWMFAQAQKEAWTSLATAGAFILVSILWIAPLVNENWYGGSVYGFGFVPRDEINRISMALREASAPDEEVLAPAFIAFQANRREMIRFPETYGVLREAEEEYARDGFLRARDHLGHENFFKLIADTAHFSRDPILKTIHDGKLNAIVPDSDIQLLPLVIPPLMLPADFQQTMVDSGFRPALQTDHFIVWQRKIVKDSVGR